MIQIIVPRPKGCKEAGGEELSVGWMGGDAGEKGISLRLPPNTHKVTPYVPQASA
jgi:hypothetical protein